MNYVANWNKLDSIIYFVEKKIKAMGEAFRESADTEPDVELMIQAETEHLRRENEDLKSREIPVYLIEENNSYLCPKCLLKIKDLNVKYCSNCGHRITRHIVGDKYKDSKDG